MDSTARLAEAARVAATFHVALVMLGAKAMAAVWLIWQAVVPTSTRIGATGSQFGDQAVEIVTEHRHEAQALAVPFFRLYRALVTGSTSQPVFGPEPEDLDLGRLRDDFALAVRKYAPEALQDGEIEDPIPDDDLDESTTVTDTENKAYQPWLRESFTVDDGDQILVDEIEELEKLLEDEEARADAEAQAVLRNLGAELLKERLAKLEDEQLSAQEADVRQEEEHTKLGHAVSAHAERLTQNGGRHAVVEMSKPDKKLIGYVRVHYPEEDPLPCGFCALLISKGIDYRPYTSEASARLKGSDFDKYHPKCHCQVLPVWSEAQYNTSTFDVNREMKKLYYDHYEDMTQWRKFMRSRAAQAAPGQE